MVSSGVICEFNPFHNGHSYLLSRMREQVGEDGCVICLMSGRFVQRGEPAIADPYVRAHMALLSGADLVLELPFPWSAGSAEFFALAGVRLLTALGVDMLTFGSETDDITLLEAAAQGAADPDFSWVYSNLCNTGMGTAAAYAQALRDVCFHNLPEGFPSSNDLLGIAYLRAIKQVREETEYAPTPHSIKRNGASYREIRLTPGINPSATALRIMMNETYRDTDDLKAFIENDIPPAGLEVLLDAVRREKAPLDPSRLMSFYHTRYRIKPPTSLRSFAEGSVSLIAHIHRNAYSTATPEEFFEALRTKQYTDARLRRALLFGALEVKEEDLRAIPRYTTLLAANEKGCAYIKKWSKEPNQGKGKRIPLSVVTKPADAPIGRQKDLSRHADALFTLCYPRPTDGGELMRRTPIIQTKNRK